ncbi:MAG TPA: hypothetical protein VNC40_00210 [Gaiellaceae bacterium]|nr:hypothetical protein [Gaiellaceae bacterium]
MRFTLPLSLVGLAIVLTFMLAGAASARESVRPNEPPAVVRLRALVANYRSLAWTYERAAHLKPAPSPLAERRSTDPAYLRAAVGRWTRRASLAQHEALAVLHRRLQVSLPAAPKPHARLAVRLAYSRGLALELHRVYPGRLATGFASARAATPGETLRLWQRRSALAALEVAQHGVAIPDWLHGSFMCIHRFEGGWHSNTGNGYYGGLQMDRGFQGLYGADFVTRWGTADNWPAWAQVQAAARAYLSGRGFEPWPNTARACGLF